MAGFHTHITVSCAVGAIYGTVGHVAYGVDLSTCVLAGGLCGLSGMLPDLDSDSGIPLRETLCLSAAVVPMLMLERWITLGFTPEMIALAGGLTYIMIRFGLGGFLKAYTVHRGMFHSLPAVVIAGLLAFLVCQSGDLGIRYFKASAVMLGYLSHLVLDEIWAIEMKYGVPRFKKSFGTAMKLYGNDTWGNTSAYAKLVLLTIVAVQDPIWMGQLEQQRGRLREMMAETRPPVQQPAPWR